MFQHSLYYHQQFIIRLKFMGSNTGNSECRSCIVKDPKIVQILSEKENPCRDHSLITVPRTYFLRGPMEDNLYLEVKQVLAV